MKMIYELLEDYEVPKLDENDVELENEYITFAKGTKWLLKGSSSYSDVYLRELEGSGYMHLPKELFNDINVFRKVGLG